MLKSIVIKNFVHFNDRTVIVLNNSQRRQTEEQMKNTSADTRHKDSKPSDCSQSGQSIGQSSIVADSLPTDNKALDKSQENQTDGQSTHTGEDKISTDKKALDNSQENQTDGQSTHTGANKIPTESKAPDSSQENQTEGQSTQAGANKITTDSKAPDSSQENQTDGQSTHTGADKIPTDNKAPDSSQENQTDGQSTHTGADKISTDKKALDNSQGNQTDAQSIHTGADKIPTDSKAPDSSQEKQTDGQSQSTQIGADSTHRKSKALDSKKENQPERQSTKFNKKTTTLDSNALNIFVGANFCGKSTVLELIRRCMTDEINVSVTRSYDESMVAYAFCQFHSSQYGEIISGIIRDPKKKKIVKVFIFENCTLVRSKWSDSKTTRSFSFKKQDGEKVIESILNKNDDGTSDNKVNDILEKIEHSIKESSSNEPNWKYLEEKFIATFPLRGIGSVQWTRSKRIGKRHKAKNYKMASERAEIISTLLSRENYEILIDENYERRIFDFLTYPEVFKFEKVKGKVKVEHNNSQFELLKTSEGIIEAKVVSLLIAHKGIQTLCLEDPDRGMHPQMIERLKTVLYDSARRKTIIVVTHSPYFVDSLTLHKTHVFVRNRLYEPYVCSVLNGENSELSKVADIENLRILLFATKVLLVEGVTDKEVVQSILTYDKRIKSEERGNSENKEERRRENSIFTGNISTHQIISINGCENVDRVQAFCEYIDLPCFCLLDRDKVIKKCKDNPTRFWGKRKDNVKIKDLETIYKFERPKNIDDYELDKIKAILKTTRTLRHYNNISEILNCWQKEKRDNDLEKHIKSLENKIVLENTELYGKPFKEYLQYFKSNTGHDANKLEEENLRTIATYWQKRKEEEAFDTFIDKLEEDNKTILPSVFWTEKKTEFKNYLEKLESNRKTFVWRNGALEDAILSSEDQMDIISEILHSIESTENMALGSKAKNSSKYDDNIEDKNRSSNQNTGSKTNKMPLKPKNLKNKLKVRLDENTREEFCKCLMKIKEIKDFISFLVKDEIKTPNIEYDDCNTPDQLNSGHTGFSLNCFSRCSSCCD